jgi:hypothetical protein
MASGRPRMALAYRSLRRDWVPACIVSLVLLTARFAAGAPNDAAAQKLCNQAIDVEYAAKDFVHAERTLNDALALCNRPADCAPFMRARIHCLLGAVEVGMHRIDLARTEFATGLLEEPDTALDPRLSNADTRREFEAIKVLTMPPRTAASADPPAASAGPPASPAAAQGGMAHSPPISQAVRTPLPLYVAVAPDLHATEVIIRYKLVGAKDWETIPMRPMGGGYGAEIPCDRVGDQEGPLQYFIQAHDANDDLVGESGRITAPYSVAIVKKPEGEPPHLPGQQPPLACEPTGAPTETSSTAVADADCPPGLPGCRGGESKSCESTGDCMASEECVDRACKPVSRDERRAYRLNWLSIGLQADLLLMPGADDACMGSRHYTCFRSDGGSYYADIPAAGRDDKVLAGFAPSPMMRILVGYDRAVLQNLTIGGRLGYAFLGGGPQRPANGATPAGASFVPAHVEARIAYWLGKNVLARQGLRFYFVVAGGIMEIDASNPIDVYATAASRTKIAVDAWTKSGLEFVSIGPGFMYAVTPNGGLLLESKVIGLFPATGIAIAVQLAYAIGL